MQVQPVEIGIGSKTQFICNWQRHCEHQLQAFVGLAGMAISDAKGQRVQVLDDIDNLDCKAPRNEYHFRTPFLVDLFTPLLKDQRDVPMLCLMLNIVQFLVPSVLLIYGMNICWDPLPPLWARNLVGFLYVTMLVLLFFERFILCLHFSSHRPIFKIEALNGILNWCFAPFFGIVSGTYKLHHVIMHHIENNHDLDISSTEHYQRDSVWHFLLYFIRFSCLIWVELPVYVVRTKRWVFFRRLMLALVVYFVGVGMLARYVSFHATMWCFIAPYVAAMTAMSFGNWSQHIFVNPQNPESNFELTYNCLDTPTNQTTFNDGYHVVHHMNARLHWSEMPSYFYEHRWKHYENGAVTFRGIHFFDVGILVLTKQLRKLAEHYVHLGKKEDAPTVDEVEAKLRAWLAPITEKTGNAKKAR